MKTKFTFIPMVLATIALMSISNAAFAGDIMFDVPVDVKSYPVPNQTLFTWCHLFDNASKKLSSGVSHPVLLSSGAYSGTSQVKVPYNASDATKIVSYECMLVVDPGGSGSSTSMPSNATILSKVSGSF